MARNVWLRSSSTLERECRFNDFTVHRERDAAEKYSQCDEAVEASCVKEVEVRENI